MVELKHIWLIILVIGIPKLNRAQQLPQFTQYMYNTISINPAYAGSREIMVVNILNRNQWFGVDGAPVTQTLSVHSSIPGSNFGAGLSVVSDRIGYEKNVFAYADMSYTINLSEKHRLAFGIKAGGSKYNLDDLLLNDPQYASDPYLQDLNHKMIPNFGAGIYFRSESLYFGFSSPKLFNYKNSQNIDYVVIDRVNIYANGGFLFDLNPNIKIKPTFLLKYTNGAPVSIDLTASVFLHELVWLAGMYRLNDSLGFLVNIKLVKGLSVGYAYDFIVSDLNPYTYGSHEIMLNFDLPWPRPQCKCKDLYN